MTFSNAKACCAHVKTNDLPAAAANKDEEPAVTKKPSAMDYQAGFAPSGGV